MLVCPVVADLRKAFELPYAIRDLPKVGFFPDSMFGNFAPHEARIFLRSV